MLIFETQRLRRPHHRGWEHKSVAVLACTQLFLLLPDTPHLSICLARIPSLTLSSVLPFELQEAVWPGCMCVRLRGRRWRVSQSVRASSDTRRRSQQLVCVSIFLLMTWNGGTESGLEPVIHGQPLSPPVQQGTHSLHISRPYLFLLLEVYDRRVRQVFYVTMTHANIYCST